MSAAQSAIDREADRKALLAQVEERSNELETRKEAFTKATAVEKKWSGAWAQACARLWAQRER